MYAHGIKRLLDVALSLVALPFVLIIMAVLAPLIHYEDKGPVFYNAPRVGKDGRPFIMYKLRSMRVNAPDLVMEDGSTYNGADDPRMTRIGTFMRKTSLDEIPQVLNVLKGDMSLIGPRPDLQREVELYEGEEGRKLTVKPGITGYAAVYGRNSLPWHDRLAFDIYYVDHLSFLLDARVFFRTFAVVLGQEGIYVEESKNETRAEAVIQGAIVETGAEALAEAAIQGAIVEAEVEAGFSAAAQRAMAEAGTEALARKALMENGAADLETP